MIQITDKTKCCGCTSCYSACPKNCITMESDFEGFLYPEVNDDFCINCGICEKVCPFNNLTGAQEHSSLYAALQYKDERKRKTSTAGGAFSLIADHILDCGGSVYAVGYDDMVVCHKRCIDKEKLQELRGSKYVQSKLDDTFAEIKDLLENGETVLFVGTPCQVHGLKNYVGEKEYLYTIDLLCLGVSSPKLFSEWINYLNYKYKAHVSHVYFRDKHYGYATPNVKVAFDNGKEIDQRYDTRVHANLFFRYYNVRPSCYQCEFREIPRVSDFTIGDFTEIGSVSKRMDDDRGTTKIWIHTHKGKELLSRVKDNCNIEVIEENNTNIVGGPKCQIKRPEKREQFFEDAVSKDYLVLVSRWQPNKVRDNFVVIARRMINVLPFKSKINKYIRRKKNDSFHKNVKDLNSN